MKLHTVGTMSLFDVSELPHGPVAIITLTEEEARAAGALLFQDVDIAAATSLPRRGDEDLREGTDAPVFLIQRRRFQPTELSMLNWDVDDEVMRDDDGAEVTEEQAVDRDLGRWEWDTQWVAFTREKAEGWCEAKAHNGPWRVYSAPAMGDLRTLLRGQTDYESGFNYNSNSNRLIGPGDPQGGHANPTAGGKATDAS